MWRYLQTIPFGETRSYGQQAREPATSRRRAVAGRMGEISFRFSFPAIAVIAANGDLTGYGRRD